LLPSLGAFHHNRVKGAPLWEAPALPTNIRIG
jgi:hypothetical protein